MSAHRAGPGMGRCHWARASVSLTPYHDHEWGVPCHDDRALWEKLMLDVFQAGLSWRIVLDKRPAFRRAFQGFDPYRVARLDQPDIERLMNDARIVRSRAKIVAVIGNARAYLDMQAVGETFGDFVWADVEYRPQLGNGQDVATATDTSYRLAAALKQRGFSFVGPTVVYAWMQAVGMVNDHALDRFRRREIIDVGP